LSNSTCFDETMIYHNFGSPKLRLLRIILFKVLGEMCLWCRSHKEICIRWESVRCLLKWFKLCKTWCKFANVSCFNFASCNANHFFIWGFFFNIDKWMWSAKYYNLSQKLHWNPLVFWCKWLKNALKILFQNTIYNFVSLLGHVIHLMQANFVPVQLKQLHGVNELVLHSN
jgi:hypothetical protein